jgi:hypothetical protein
VWSKKPARVAVPVSCNAKWPMPASRRAEHGTEGQGLEFAGRMAAVVMQRAYWMPEARRAATAHCELFRTNPVCESSVGRRHTENRIRRTPESKGREEDRPNTSSPCRTFLYVPLPGFRPFRGSRLLLAVAGGCRGLQPRWRAEFVARGCWELQWVAVGCRRSEIERSVRTRPMARPFSWEDRPCLVLRSLSTDPKAFVLSGSSDYDGL